MASSGFANCAAAGKANNKASKLAVAVNRFFIGRPDQVIVLYSFACF
jgi:hypothetical protein